MFCKQCGREQRYGEKYCAQCGAPYSKEKASEKIVRNVTNESNRLSSMAKDQMKAAKEKAGSVLNGKLPQDYQKQGDALMQSVKQHVPNSKVIVRIAIGIFAVIALWGVVKLVKGGGDAEIEDQLSGNFEINGTEAIMKVDATIRNTTPYVEIVEGDGEISTHNQYMTERICVPAGETWMYNDGVLEVHLDGMVYTFENKIQIYKGGRSRPIVSKLNWGSYTRYKKWEQDNTIRHGGRDNVSILTGGDEFAITTMLPLGFTVPRSDEIGESTLKVEGNISFVRINKSDD